MHCYNMQTSIIKQPNVKTNSYLKKIRGRGMELYGEEVGFSSNLYNSGRVKIK